MVEAFEGNAAETTRMLPTIRAFMAAHQLADVPTVADAGMVSNGTVVRARNGADGDPRSVSERYTVPYRLAAARRQVVLLLGRSRRRRPSPSRRADDGYWGGCGTRTGPDAVVLVHQQPLGSGRSPARRASAPASLQLVGGRRQTLARQCLILDGIAAVRDTLHDTNSCRLEWFPAAGVASAATVVAGGRPVGSFRVLS
jgi:hypothetical protein